MDCAIDRRFVIIIAIDIAIAIANTIIISYLTFTVTLFKVCSAALRSEVSTAFFSLIRSRPFYFAHLKLFEFFFLSEEWFYIQSI